MSDTRIPSNVIDQSGRYSQDQIQDQIAEVKARNDVLQQRAQSYLGLSNTIYQLGLSSLSKHFKLLSQQDQWIA
jgi:hypothetical protein